MRFGNGLYDDKPQAQAVFARCREGRAELGDLFLGERAPVVFDREANFFGSSNEAHPNRARRLRLLRRPLGVFEKVEEKKEEFESVSLHHGFLFGEFERHGRAA